MSWQDLRTVSITEAVKARAEDVREHAFTHRETARQVANRLTSNTPGPGNDPAFILEVPVGYKVVYSIEQQPNGWCQHFAFAVNRPKMAPNPEAVSQILEQCFGIRWNMRASRPTANKPDTAVAVWEDERLPGVVNILFPFKFPAT